MNRAITLLMAIVLVIAMASACSSFSNVDPAVDDSTAPPEEIHLEGEASEADVMEGSERHPDTKTLAPDVPMEQPQTSAGTVELDDNSPVNFAEGLAAVRIDGKFGFVNEEMELVIPAIYDEAEAFCGGVAMVRKDGKWGAVDQTGQLTVPLIYDFLRIAFSYDSGLAWYYKDGKLGYVHKSGKEITPPIYDFSFHQCGSSMADSNYMNGLAMVERDGKFGYIDEAGTEVIPVIYDQAIPFYQHLGETSRVLSDDVWYEIDKEGNIIGLVTEW